MLTEDYIIRMIKDFGNMMSRLLLGRITGGPPVMETVQTVQTTDLPPFPRRLFELIDRGEINEAENLLFEELDFSNPKNCEVVLQFYGKLHTLSPQKLEACGYSHEEILEGMKDCAEKFGINQDLLQTFEP